MDWKDIAETQYKAGASWPQIYAAVHAVDNRVMETAIRGHIRRTTVYKESHRQERPTLVFSDPHVPFDHEGYLPFLIDVHKEKRCGRVVSNGDLTDQHVFSRFTPEAVAKGAIEEYTSAKKRLGEYFKAFPSGYLTTSNHDWRYVKKAASVGIPGIFLRTFHELFGVPKEWEIADEFVLDGVLYKHGENCGGKDGALKAAQANGMSVCIGHFHSLGGCQYFANPNKLMFGMNVGCGIDRQAYAFAYGKHDKDKPILGCGIVYNDSHAEFIPMPREYFRSA